MRPIHRPAIQSPFAFAAMPTFFTEGQPVNIDNGQIPGTPAILFKNASTVTGDLSQLTEDQINALPAFTGSGAVFGFEIGTAPVPEPGTAFFCVAALGLLSLRKASHNI